MSQGEQLMKHCSKAATPVQSKVRAHLAGRTTGAACRAPSGEWGSGCRNIGWTRPRSHTAHDCTWSSSTQPSVNHTKRFLRNWNGEKNVTQDTKFAFYFEKSCNQLGLNNSIPVSIRYCYCYISSIKYKFQINTTFTSKHKPYHALINNKNILWL